LHAGSSSVEIKMGILYSHDCIHMTACLKTVNCCIVADCVSNCTITDFRDLPYYALLCLPVPDRGVNSALYEPSPSQHRNAGSLSQQELSGRLHSPTGSRLPKNYSEAASKE